MIKYSDYTVFDMDTQVIVNTVNCKGVMGAGLALEFKLRYPEMFRDYRKRCKQNMVKPGRPYLFNELKPWILNFPTKYHWRYPSRIEWIEEGLRYFAQNYHRMNIRSIAFPKLGCRNGGLDWSVVKPVMEKYLVSLDIEVFICLDEKPKPWGVEDRMIKLFNKIKEDIAYRTKVQSDIGIRGDVLCEVVKKLPVTRFREIRRIRGVGKGYYEKIFVYFYHQVVGEKT
ncbi:macro domain-containing protein [Candidatus Poribacteria bacterium]|nr:macro domain-containing protein [Candidatus Poribacteria bacterium]